MRALSALLLLVGLAGCGEPTPDTPVEDPETYLRTQLIAALETPSSGLPTHVLDDAVFLDSVIDATLTRRRTDEALPSESRQLDRIVRSAAQTYRANLLDAPARRAAVEARIREQFEASPVEIRGTTAVTDLGSAPGRFEPGMRTGWDLSDAPETANGLLRPPAVASVLGRMQYEAPTAHAFLFDVRIPHGTSSRRVRYFYAPTEDYLRMRIGGEEYVSSEPVNGLEGLGALETPRHALDMFNRICAFEGDPPCPDVWNP